MSEFRCQHGVSLNNPCLECGRKASLAKVEEIDPKRLAAVILKHRVMIRHMMQQRCKVPGCPIPAALANRVADWILIMVSFRANERRKAGKQAFPKTQTLADDVARSAEGIEILFTVAIEESMGVESLITGMPPLEAANDDSITH